MELHSRELHSSDLPETANKQEFYRELALQLSGLLTGERDSIANAANTAALLYHALPDVNWVGFYLLKEGELVRGPFQGKPACVRIALGRGVCGTAAGARRSVVVPDVHAFSGHIACDTARALRVVEHEVLGLYVAVYEVVRLAAQAAVETLRLRLAGAFDDLDLQQPIAYQQRGGDASLDRLLVLAPHHEAVHHGVHVPDLGFVEFRFRGDVHRLTIDDQDAASLLAHLGQHEVQFLAVLPEYRRAQLDRGAFRQRQNRLQDLARRPAGSQLAGARAVRHSDGGVQEIEVAGDVGQGSDRGARVVGDGFLQIGRAHV